jgi:hypothetical protein
MESRAVKKDQDSELLFQLPPGSFAEAAHARATASMTSFGRRLIASR